MAFRWHSPVAAGMIDVAAGRSAPRPPADAAAASARAEAADPALQPLYVEFLRVLEMAPREDFGRLTNEAASALLGLVREAGVVLDARGAGALLALSDRGQPSPYEFSMCCTGRAVAPVAGPPAAAAPTAAAPRRRTQQPAQPERVNPLRASFGGGASQQAGRGISIQRVSLNAVCDKYAASRHVAPGVMRELAGDS